MLLGRGTNGNWQAAVAEKRRNTQHCPAPGKQHMGMSLSAACVEAAGSLANTQYRRVQACQLGPILLSLNSKVWMGPTGGLH